MRKRGGLQIISPIMNLLYFRTKAGAMPDRFKRALVTKLLLFLHRQIMKLTRFFHQLLHQVLGNSMICELRSKWVFNNIIDLGLSVTRFRNRKFPKFLPWKHPTQHRPCRLGAPLWRESEGGVKWDEKNQWLGWKLQVPLQHHHPHGALRWSGRWKGWEKNLLLILQNLWCLK